MYKKNKFIFFFLLITFVIFTSCVTSNINNISNVPEINNNESQFSTKEEKPKRNQDYIIIGIDENLDYLISNIEYPEFKDLPGLNKYIKNFIVTGWSDFKEFAKNDWNDITSLNSNTLPPYEYYVKTSIYNSKDIKSIYFNIYSYKGGAHGETVIKTINYDTQNEKYLIITEASGFTYEELSDICRKELHNKLISDNKFEIEQQEALILSEMIDEGTLPIASNFEAFTINKKEITVYFSQGKVAPNYYGEQSVSIPLKK